MHRASALRARRFRWSYLDSYCALCAAYFCAEQEREEDANSAGRNRCLNRDPTVTRPFFHLSLQRLCRRQKAVSCSRKRPTLRRRNCRLHLRLDSPRRENIRLDSVRPGRARNSTPTRPHSPMASPRRGSSATLPPTPPIPRRSTRGTEGSATASRRAACRSRSRCRRGRTAAAWRCAPRRCRCCRAPRPRPAATRASRTARRGGSPGARPWIRLRSMGTQGAEPQHPVRDAVGRVQGGHELGVVDRPSNGWNPTD